jgi:hypothetical protein
VGDNFASLQQVLEEVKVFEVLRSHPNVVNYKHSWLEMSTNADFGPQGIHHYNTCFTYVI